MDHVLWIGGGCGSGKTTIARGLADRFDLQLYPVDARGYDHERRLGGPARPSYDELWLTPSPEEIAERFVRASADKLPLIVQDLVALRDGPLVVAEGPLLFPALVAGLVASPAHGVWLVPTEEFQEWALRKRGGVAGVSDPGWALRKRLARDAILNRLVRSQATDLGFGVLDVDGSRDLSQMGDVVASWFADLVAAGPRARDGEERRRMRRKENAAVHDQLLAWRADVGMAEPPEFPFSCECTNLGCRERVVLRADAYGRSLRHPSDFVVAAAHASGVPA